MKQKYCIKIRVFPPKKVCSSCVTQIMPDYDHPRFENEIFTGSFEDASSRAVTMLRYHHQFIGTRAEVVFVAEV